MAFPLTPRSRRNALFLGAFCVILCGLALHFLVPGDFASLSADALYAALVYLVLALVLPRAGQHWLALTAFALSAFVELAQLTGIPGQLAVGFPPSRLLLGTTFSALDLVAYAAGAAAAWLVDRTLSGARGVRHKWNSPAAGPVPPE